MYGRACQLVERTNQMALNTIKFAKLVSFLSMRFERTLNEDTLVDIAAYANEINEPQNRTNVTAMFKAIVDGRKIDAIREHRAITGMPLKESKEEIETIYDIISRPVAVNV